MRMRTCIGGVLGAALFVSMSGCQHSHAGAIPAAPSFGTMAEARAALPAGCDPAPLYVLDGVPQDDSVSVYALAPDRIKTISVIWPTENPKCPVVSVVTRRL